MADLAIVIDTSSIADAKKKVAAFQAQLGNNKSVLGLTSALGTVESGVKQLVAAQAKGQISSRTYQQGLLEQKRALMALGLSSQLASARVQQLANELRNQSAAKAAAAALEQAARASKALADRQRELRMRFQEGYANFAMQREAMRSLREAYRSGIITIEQYRAQLERLRLVNNGNIRGTNNLGVMMQQTGYQVGDFAVQVQSGANVMVAFGQQATQLVGALYLLPPAVLATQVPILGLTVSVTALIAAFSIIIPISTAIAGSLLRARKAAKEASEPVQTLETRVKALTDSLKEFERTKKAISLGITPDELTSSESLDKARNNLESFRKARDELLSGSNINSNKGMRILGEGLFGGGEASQKSIDKTFDSFLAAIGTVFKLEDKLASEQKDNFNERDSYLQQEIAMQKAIQSSGENSSEVRSLALAQDVSNMEKAVNAQVLLGELSGPYGEQLKARNALLLRLGFSIEDARIKTESLLEAELKRTESIQRFYDLQQKTTEETSATLSGVNAIKDAVAATTKTLENRLEISKLTLQFGKDSEEVANKEADIARAAFKLALEDNKIKGNNLIAAMRLYDAAVLNEKAIAAAAAESKELEGGLKGAAAAMQSLVGFGQGLEKALAVAVAQSKAIKDNVSTANAGTIAGMRVDLQDKTNNALGQEGADPLIIRAQSAIDSATIDALESQLSSNESATLAKRASTKSGSSGGSSGGSPAQELQDYLTKLQQQSEIEGKLVGIFGTKRSVEEEILNARNKYGEVMSATQEKELRGTLLQIEADKERQKVLEEAKAQQQQVADSIANSMGNALMSMVDGTKSVKDAFKDMARSIIKELYQVLVVERMVQSISGALGGSSGGGSILASVLGGGGSAPSSSLRPPVSPFANGGAFSGGSQIQAYANGGVVGGPAYFPMSGGKTGLMGEAGPEAIMPLKRGANGKLGVQAEGSSGGGSVVIHQNFNLSANGDDSVKKLIAQAAPKIAQMTQAAMIDSRRRGGAMKSTFS